MACHLDFFDILYYHKRESEVECVSDFWERERFFYEREHRTDFYGGHLHYHNRLEIYYLEEGACRYFIDTDTYTLQAGDVLVIPAGVLHTAVYQTSTHTRHLIQCDVQYVPHSVRPMLPNMVYICRQPRLQEEIKGLLKQIGREYGHPDELARDAVCAHVGALLILLARAQREALSVPAADDFVARAVFYMKAHYAEPLTLSAVAAYCAVSCEHLSRSFKKKTGFGFNEYLTLYRLKQAQTMLLSDTPLSVGRVAELCGFNDSNYFASRCKRIFGLSPSELRRQGGEGMPRMISLP